jgi:hypothetical protein
MAMDDILVPSFVEELSSVPLRSINKVYKASITEQGGTGSLHRGLAAAAQGAWTWWPLAKGIIS